MMNLRKQYKVITAGAICVLLPVISTSAYGQAVRSHRATQPDSSQQAPPPPQPAPSVQQNNNDNQRSSSPPVGAPVVQSDPTPSQDLHLRSGHHSDALESPKPVVTSRPVIITTTTNPPPQVSAPVGAPVDNNRRGNNNLYGVPSDNSWMNHATGTPGDTSWMNRATGTPGDTSWMNRGVGPIGAPSYDNHRSERPVTPQGPDRWQREHERRHHHYYDNTTIVTDGPVFIGGYYYPYYSDNYTSTYTYPSVYTYYGGFPQYIYNPGVIVVENPYYPSYYTPYLPFYAPSYQVVYNSNTYYVDNKEDARILEKGGKNAESILDDAYPKDSYQAAFADIEKAWTTGKISYLSKHLRSDETKISVLLDKKYSYSINSDDFKDITRDALERLQTVSFKFNRMRKAKNGDITAYAVHVYKGDTNDTNNDMSNGDDTVPFSTSSPYSKSDNVYNDMEKKVYVSYTIRRHNDQWYVVMVDSSDKPLVKGQDTEDND